MRVLVTGSSGFVGAALCDALVRRGDRVVGVDRATGPMPAGAGSFRFHAADLRAPGALDGILAEGSLDAVVVGAAVTADAGRERGDPGGVAAVNVVAVVDAVRAAARAGVPRILYLGSGAVYGDSAAGPTPLDEDETPLRPRSLYAITKQAGEAAALRLADTFGVALVAARLGTCFGPFERDTGVRDTLSPPYQVLRLAEAGAPIALPRPGRRDWLYVRDAVAGLMALLDAPALPRRVYNVAAGFEWSMVDWCGEVARRRPGFVWSVSGPERANVAFHDAVDRAPMRIDRLLADTAFRPRYGLAEAASDFLDGVDGGRP